MSSRSGSLGTRATFARDQVLGIGAGPTIGQESNVYDFLTANELESLSKTSRLLRGPTKTYFTSSDLRRAQSRKLLCDALDQPLFEPTFRQIRIWRRNEQELEENDGELVYFGIDDDYVAVDQPGPKTMRSFLERVFLNSIKPISDPNNKRILVHGPFYWHVDILFQYCELGLVPFARRIENYSLGRRSEDNSGYIDYYVFTETGRSNAYRDFINYLEREHNLTFDFKNESEEYIQALQGYGDIELEYGSYGVETEPEVLRQSQQYKNLIRSRRAYIIRISEDDFSSLQREEAYYYSEEYTENDGSRRTRLAAIALGDDDNYEFTYFLMRKLTQQLIIIATHPELCGPRPPPTFTLPTLRGRKRARTEYEAGDNEEDDDDEEEEEGKDGEDESKELGGGKTYYTFKKSCGT